MARFTTMKTAALRAAALFALAAAPALAQPSTITLSGTVVRVGSHEIAVRENARGQTGTWVLSNAAQFHAGEHVVAVGTEDTRGYFYPSSISVGMSTVTLAGVVQRIWTHTLAVWEPGPRTTGEWIVANPGAFLPGQYVTGTGTEDRTGRFYPQSISVLTHPNVPGSITLSGVVQRVGVRMLTVWEPARHTTGEWVFAGAGSFRAGQRITGTGTEDREGHFYPATVWAP